MIITVIMVAALIMSAVVHEVAHGFVAYRLGDNTAKDQGRLNLNPLKHLDLFGSIILPILLVLTKANFFLAWAKPVPINPYRLRDKKYGMLKVAVAGPLSNLILAGIFGTIGRFLPLTALEKYSLLMAYFGDEAGNLLNMMGSSIFASMYVLSFSMCMVNIGLMIFNLIPWPPLDGSKIIFPFLPLKLKEFFLKLEMSIGGMLILFALVSLGAFDFLGVFVVRLFGLIMGISV